MKPLFVLLDAGHGAETPGKRSPVWEDGSQLLEYKFNRQVVDSLTIELYKRGIKHMTLVSTDSDTPLSVRTNKANSIYNQYKRDYYVVLISIHGNAFNDPSASGIEVWTYFGQSEADVFADDIMDALEVLGWKMRRDLGDGDSDKEANFYILKHTKMPAILLELGFFTNEEECKKMLDPNVRRTMAKYIANGLSKYRRRP